LTAISNRRPCVLEHKLCELRLRSVFGNAATATATGNDDVISKKNQKQSICLCFWFENEKEMMVIKMNLGCAFIYWFKVEKFPYGKYNIVI